MHHILCITLLQGGGAKEYEMEALETSNCPWCGSLIPQSTVSQIQTRIDAERKANVASIEARLGGQFDQQLKVQLQDESKKLAAEARKQAEFWAAEQTRKFQLERDDAIQKAKAVELQARTLVETERKAAEERTKEQTRKLQTERDDALQRAKAVELQSKTLLEAERKVAEERTKEQTRKLQTERDEALQRAKAVELQAKTLVEAERKAAQERTKEQTHKLQTERDDALQKAKAVELQAKTLVETERKAAEERTKEQTRKLELERDSALQKAKEVEANQAKIATQLLEKAGQERKKELDAQRQILERDHEQREKKLCAEFTREHEKTKNKVGALERQLQKKTAHELGDGAELDLYEELRNIFPGDHFSRVPKGEPGADIHHQIYYKGQSCGKIVYDSKNRQAWQDKYASKLSADQKIAGAAHAILATNSFPSGKKEFCLFEGVIAVSPARVCSIVELLRNSMVRMHVLNLSLEERTDKMAQLYALISSEAFNQKFKEADKLAEGILDLDVKEFKAHQEVWKKRGLITKQLKTVVSEIDIEICAIVERTGAVLKRTSPAISAEFRPKTNTLQGN